MEDTDNIEVCAQVETVHQMALMSLQRLYQRHMTEQQEQPAPDQEEHREEEVSSSVFICCSSNSEIYCKNGFLCQNRLFLFCFVFFYVNW